MKNKPYPLYEKALNVSGISDMLEKQAALIPEKVAFRYRAGKDKIDEKTFGDVYLEVRKAASWIEKNYGKGNHIAIIGENSYEWLIAFFATVCSGNVAVPIDKELPADEVRWLLDKAEAKHAFISKTYSDLLEGAEDVTAVTLKKLQEYAADGDEKYELYHANEDELCAIFFTSGTSGKSKGVMLSHGNIAAELTQTCKMFDPEGDVTLSVLPFHHAFGLIVAIFMAYNYGTATFLNKSLKRVKEDIRLAKPNVIMLVPMFIEVFYKQIMDNIKKTDRMGQLEKGLKISNALLKIGIDRRRSIFKDVHEVFGGNLKYIISGGAFLDAKYVRAFRHFGIEILNGYGTTECSPCVAINRNYYKKDGSVGPLIPMAEARISPEGEVEIKSPVNMMGYYNDPDATAEVIRDGWYRTGDLGRVDEDGFLFLTGRIKNLIILSNGENISPEELENDFEGDPNVCEVIVYAKGGALIAEIFPEEEYLGNQEYFDELMTKVNEGRPVYKQISKVVLRDTEFIKNTSKKIVRYKNIPGQG